MAQKKLQKDSEFAKYDMDGDGVVSDEELAMEERMIDLENWVIWQEFTSLPLLVLLQHSLAHKQ